MLTPPDRRFGLARRRLELQRLSPARLHVLGGQNTVTSAVPAQLAQPGFTVTTREGVVTRVIDGDTIVVAGLRVRLVGIDAPESGECGFAEATARVRELVDYHMPGGRFYDATAISKPGEACFASAAAAEAAGFRASFAD